jgi:hypothetical protein
MPEEVETLDDESAPQRDAQQDSGKGAKESDSYEGKQE